jgi:hypothetical protein
MPRAIQLERALFLYSPVDLGYLHLVRDADGGYGRPTVIRDGEQLKRVTDGKSGQAAGGEQA